MKRYIVCLFLILAVSFGYGQCPSPCCCFTDLTATITAPEEICFPVGVTSVSRTITVTPSGGTAPYSYAWTIVPVQPDPGDSNSGTFTLTETTEFTVTVTDDVGCEYIVNTLVDIENAPDATLNTNPVYLCENCGNIASVDLTLYEPAGVVGQWFEGDQSGACSSPSGPVANPSNVILTQPFSQYTFGVSGSGACAGQVDCDVLEIYFNINMDLPDLEVVGDVCDDSTIDILITDFGSPVGACFADWIDWNNTAGINNAASLVSPTGIGESVITDGSGNIIGWTFPTGPLQNTVTNIEINLDGTTTGGGLCTSETVDVDIDGTGCCTTCSGSVSFSGDASNSCEDLEFTINPSGCTGPYTYAWSGSGGLSETGAGSGLTGTITSSNEGLDVSGTYTVTVTDANGCTFEDDRSYSSCDNDVIEITNVTVSGTGCDGSDSEIEITVLNWNEACDATGDDWQFRWFLDGVEAYNTATIVNLPNNPDCTDLTISIDANWDDPTIVAGGTFEFTIEMYNLNGGALLDTYTYGDVTLSACP